MSLEPIVIYIPPPIGISTISNEIPTEFKLYQNYPNPFNPVTKIRFAVPVNSLVTLTLYDLLGKEIEQLIKKELATGIYEVDWKPDKLASGVYLYSLEAGNIRLNRKLVYLK